MVMIALPQMTKNIGELMSQHHAIQKRKNRDALLCIIRSIKFLCRQGLALRGGGDGLWIFAPVAIDEGRARS